MKSKAIPLVDHMLMVLAAKDAVVREHGFAVLEFTPTVWYTLVCSNLTELRSLGKAEVLGYTEVYK